MIVLWTSRNCPRCLAVKKILELLKVKYEEADAHRYEDFLMSKNLVVLPILQIKKRFYSITNTSQVTQILEKENII